MRLITALCLGLANPAVAWEFAPLPVCTLTHDTTDGTLTVTYDAGIPEYTITLTRATGAWPDAPIFAMAFAGDRPIAIQTDRHQRSPDGRSLTVTDSGFGNVLNGLEFNATATGFAGDATLAFDLSGIGPAITAFRACPADNLT